MSNQLLSPCHIFLKSDFHKLEFYVELKFHELEFQNSDKLLNISQTVVDCKIFQSKIVFGHFGWQMNHNSFVETFFFLK